MRQYHARIDDTLFKKIVSYAKTTNRSINNAIVFMCSEFLKGFPKTK